jgi:hypothetical protein
VSFLFAAFAVSEVLPVKVASGPDEVIEERQLSGLPFFNFDLNIPRIGDVQRHTKA